MPELLFGPIPNKQAVSFIKSKPPVSRSVFGELLPELQGRAFTVSGIENVKVLQQLRDRIADVPAGADWDDVKIELANTISPYLKEGSGPEAEAQAQLAGERRAELLLRTHAYQAYNAAQYDVMQRQKDVFKFWRYQTAHDDKVREAHAALDGIVLPADDPFWQTHFPPWDFNCRCQVVPLSDEDMKDIEKEDATKPADERSILDEAQRDQMNKSGFLIRGPSKNVDVRPPSQKHGGDGYSWQPGNMGMSVADLKARYEPEVFNTFRTWAKQTKLPGGNKTVWSWIGGSGEWPDLSELTDVKKLGGSTGAELVQDSDGRKFVRKLGNSAAHIESEAAADLTYAALGVNVPKVKLYPGPQPIKLAQYIEGKTLKAYLAGATPAEAEMVLAQVRGNFVADALIGNYDVIGLDADNILVDKAGHPWRIDNGGSFKFRAQGKLKDSFGPEVKELQTMRDPKINAAAAKVFGAVTDADIKAQITEILQKRDAVLATVPADVREVMGKRLDWLAAHITPQGGEAFAEQVVKSRIVGRAAKWDKLDIEDTQVLFWSETDKAGARTLRAKMKLTEQGSAKIMDQLKSALPAAPVGTPQDNYWSSIEKAAKTVNQHAKDGAYNAATLAGLQATKATLAQLELTGANAGLKQHYLDIIAKIEAAKDAKATTEQFAAWKFKPEAAPDRTTGLHITRERVDYTAKETRRGHARDQGDKIYSHDAYVVNLDGMKAKFVPFKNADGSTDFNAPYALRGYLEIERAGATDAAAVTHVADQLARIGLDTSAATEPYAELLYLRKGIQIRTDVFTPAKLEKVRTLLTDAKLSDAEKVTQLKGVIKKALDIELPDVAGPGYDWRAKGNSFGDGWARTERWDLPRTKIETELPGWTLHHSSSTAPDKLINSILEGGGDFTATTERLRKGIAITSGMSPQADLDSGGANYLFTRIFKPKDATSAAGLNFKIGNLARQDAFSFDRDRYGNVKTAEAYKVRAKTIEDFKRCSNGGGNETILKYGISLLDELDSIVVDSSVDRKKVLAVFKDHGWEKLPDGRAVADIIRIK